MNVVSFQIIIKVHSLFKKTDWNLLRIVTRKSSGIYKSNLSLRTHLRPNSLTQAISKTVTQWTVVIGTLLKEHSGTFGRFETGILIAGAKKKAS